MSWHSFPLSSVLGCLRSRHASAKLETLQWNIITRKQDYHEQRLQMGLEMILCYSEIIGHSSSSGEPSSPEYFLGAWHWHSRHLASTLAHPSLLGNTGQCPNWAEGHLRRKPTTSKELCSRVPCIGPALDGKG